MQTGQYCRCRERKFVYFNLRFRKTPLMHNLIFPCSQGGNEGSG